MSKRDHSTEITDTGLRYKSKIAGSPFSAKLGSAETMSCFKCGRHKPRINGSFKRLLGCNQFFCAECRPVQEPIDKSK